jgi:hypothetical protein
VPKAELETAMSDLIDAGRVVPVEIGKNEYRKPIMSLAPSGYFSAGKSAGEKSDNSENGSGEINSDFPEDPRAAPSGPLYRGGGPRGAPQPGARTSLRTGSELWRTEPQNIDADPNDISDLLN